MLMTKPSDSPLDVLAGLVQANVPDKLLGQVARALIAQQYQRSEISENFEPTVPGGVTRNVIVDCKDSDNKRTTVSFIPQRWNRLIALEPDEAVLKNDVKRLAEIAPTRRRSAWIFETLQHELEQRVKDCAQSA